jgi:arginine decarboxylase
VTKRAQSLPVAPGGRQTKSTEAESTQGDDRIPTALTIRVSAGTGTGATRLAAFDAALRGAGIGDFNLVRLSSVIPPRSVVVEVDAPDQVVGAHGDRLYCVYAEAYASTPSEEAWAGVAWSTKDDESGDGLFVEHAGSSRATVEHDLRLSLAELSRGRGGAFLDAGIKVASAECVDHPVCAVVVATYQSAPWSDDGI